MHSAAIQPSSSSSSSPSPSPSPSSSTAAEKTSSLASLSIIRLHHESSPSGRQFLFTCCCEFQPLIVRISLGRSGSGGAYWAFQALLLIWQALSSRGREVHGRLSRSWFLSIMITVMVMKIVITIIIIITIITIMIIMMKCSQGEGGPWLAIGELVALYTQPACDPGPWPLLVKCWRRKIQINSCKLRPVNQVGGDIYSKRKLRLLAGF